MPSKEASRKNLEKARAVREQQLAESNNPERNSKNLAFAIKIMELGEPFTEQDRKSVPRIRDRLGKYLELCVDEGERATVEGIALALNITRGRLLQIRSGQTKYPQEIVELLNMYIQLVNTSLVQESVNGDGNQLIEIFLLKTNFQYIEQQYINVVSQPEEVVGLTTKEEIEKKYDVIDITADIE